MPDKPPYIGVEFTQHLLEVIDALYEPAERDLQLSMVTGFAPPPHDLQKRRMALVEAERLLISYGYRQPWKPKE